LIGNWDSSFHLCLLALCFFCSRQNNSPRALFFKLSLLSLGLSLLYAPVFCLFQLSLCFFFVPLSSVFVFPLPLSGFLVQNPLRLLPPSFSSFFSLSSPPCRAWLFPPFSPPFCPSLYCVFPPFTPQFFFLLSSPFVRLLCFFLKKPEATSRPPSPFFFAVHSL